MLKNGSRRLVLLTLFLGCVQFAAAQTADDIIEKDLAALGGRTALSNLRSRSMKGTITGSSPVGDLTGPVEILNEVPNKSRTFVQFDLSGLGLGKFVQDQRFDGTSGYVIDTMQGNRDITGEQLDAMKNAQFPSPLLNYKGMGTTVELAGKEKVGDRDAYVLIAKPKAGPVIRYYIDAETYLPIRSVMKIMDPQLGTEVEQTTDTSDFREVDSVKVPFRIKTTSSLRTVLVTITQVEQNKQIDQSLFSKPDANTAAALDPPRRPQNPIKPYPYKEEDVAYPNQAADAIKFAATLTIPSGAGPFPAVFLITGSGPQDRDETLRDHKPFLVLSDYLTRQGIVVLRADDRGVGKSEGAFAGATTADFATDAEAALAYLKTRPEVDHRKTGLIGHSEGGIIAPLVASRNQDVAFIVMLAGSGVPGDQIIMAQTEAINRTSGLPPERVAAAMKQERAVLDVVLHEKDDAVAQARLKGQFSLPDSEVKQLTAAWYRYFLEYDPTLALRKVKCPVLALNGEKDVQVPPRLNLPAIRAALDQGGNKLYEIVELPGLNHLFQTAKTGAVSEYSEIEETMSPSALEKIAAFIAKQ